MAQFTLHVTCEALILEAPLQQGTSSCLRLEESKDKQPLLTLEPRSSGLDGCEPRSLPVYAILGLVKLHRGNYLGVVTKAVHILQNGPNGAQLSQVLAAEFIPLPTKQQNNLTSVQLQQEMEFLEMLQSVVRSECLYFSHNYDITQSSQRIALLNDHNNPFLEDGFSGFWNSSQSQTSSTGLARRVPRESSGSVIGLSESRQERTTRFDRADPRFMWNLQFVKSFDEAGFKDWIHPFMCGLVDVKERIPFPPTEQSIQTPVSEERELANFTYIFISRRAREHQGTRFNMRGLSPSGNAANFVEIEQLVIPSVSRKSTRTDIALLSHVQTRGSIPALWSQKVNLKYTPRVQTESTSNALHGFEAFKKHFLGAQAQHSLDHYGNATCINLVDRSGSSRAVQDQRSLGQTYGNFVEKVNDHRLRYIWFDFHHECKKMNFSNIGKLLAQVEGDIEKYGFFLQLKNEQVERWQTGVFRTNCMDNLDRTNVVQTVIARQTLLDMLRFSSITATDTSHQVSKEALVALKLQDRKNFLRSPYPVLERSFQDAWRSNANTMSVLYAGTPALKTRIGFLGLLQDGANSVTRYFINNFSDGWKQDAIDLFLGQVDVEAVAMRNLKWQHPLAPLLKHMKKLLLSFLAAVFLLSVWFGLKHAFILASLLVWTVFAIVAHHIFKNGLKSTRFVSTPRFLLHS